MRSLFYGSFAEKIQKLLLQGFSPDGRRGIRVHGERLVSLTDNGTDLDSPGVLPLCVVTGAPHMPKPGYIEGLLGQLVRETCTLHDVEPLGERLDQGLGGCRELPGNIIQKKIQRGRTKIILFVLLVVPLLAILGRWVLVRRIAREPTPLAGGSMTPLAR